MVEGGETMPIPEQEKPVSAEQQTKQPSFEDRLRDLTEPKTDKKGKVLQEPTIRNKNIRDLIDEAVVFAGKTIEGLEDLIRKGNRLCSERTITKESWGEWSIVAAEFNEEMERLLAKRQSGTERVIGTPKALEQQSEIQKQLLEAFKKLPPEREKERWTDVEWDQDFWSRFTPSMEPDFYKGLSSEERKDWDARWQLARAAFYKKRLSAAPAELVKNEDLQLLTTEQMERLYNLPGVKEALEWYVEQIVKGKHKIYFDEKTGRRLNGEEVSQLSEEEKKKKGTLLDCEKGYQFGEFRKDLEENILSGKKRWDWDERKKEKKGEERELSDLEKKSADAIAWNFIWCCNLVESLDSRYSLEGGDTKLRLRYRHGGLSPELCSDDLRAVFHPQEKFEDKCWDQDWGMYGRWGITQLARIKRELDLREKDKEEGRIKIVYKQEGKVRDFWRATQDETGKEITIQVPECYPTITMKSFLETYECEDKEGERRTLLQHLLKKKEINWTTLRADLWRTNYLTVRLPRAVALLGIFKNGKIESGWTRDLLDIYTRLGIRKLLINYYSVKEGEKKGERLANIRFHNLKVWAYFAPFGGVGRPQDKKPFDPFSTSKIRVGAQMNLSDREYVLRQPQSGYLNKGERLKIKDVG